MGDLRKINLKIDERVTHSHTHAHTLVHTDHESDALKPWAISILTHDPATHTLHCAAAHLNFPISMSTLSSLAFPSAENFVWLVFRLNAAYKYLWLGTLN